MLTGDMNEYYATSETKRYVVGPMVTTWLPLGFRFEFDALYRRAGYRVFSADIFGTFASRYRGNSWEFPLLVRHHVYRSVYAGVGYAGRVINGSGHANSIFNSLVLGMPATFSQSDVRGEWETTHGVLGEAGIEKRFGPLRIAPAVRYTFWTRPAVEVYGSRGFQVVSTQHQADILVGLTF